MKIFKWQTIPLHLRNWKILQEAKIGLIFGELLLQILVIDFEILIYFVKQSAQIIWQKVVWNIVNVITFNHLNVPLRVEQIGGIIKDDLYV